MKFHQELERLMNSNLGFNQLILLLTLYTSRFWVESVVLVVVVVVLPPPFASTMFHLSAPSISFWNGQQLSSSSQVILQEDGGKLPNQARSLSFHPGRSERPESVSVMPDSLFPDHCA